MKIIFSLGILLVISHRLLAKEFRGDVFLFFVVVVVVQFYKVTQQSQWIFSGRRVHLAESHQRGDS